MYVRVYLAAAAAFLYCVVHICISSAKDSTNLLLYMWVITSIERDIPTSNEFEFHQPLFHFIFFFEKLECPAQSHPGHLKQNRAALESVYNP